MFAFLGVRAKAKVKWVESLEFLILELVRLEIPDVRIGQA